MFSEQSYIRHDVPFRVACFLEQFQTVAHKSRIIRSCRTCGGGRRDKGFAPIHIYVYIYI